jgi:hypothetical protein
MQEASMNPISQIELNAHFKGLEKQMATARGSQGAAFYWLRMLWRKERRLEMRTEPTLRGTRVSLVERDGCTWPFELPAAQVRFDGGYCRVRSWLSIVHAAGVAQFGRTNYKSPMLDVLDPPKPLEADE